jgi:hypothetical protein
MRYGLVCALLATVLLCLPLAFAQPATAVHVCVASLDGAGGGASPTASRDALVKLLGKQKNAQLEGVPLNAVGPTEALIEAKEKNCDYVVTTNMVGLQSERGASPAVAGTTPVETQTFHVTLDYKLNKVSDGAEASSGSLKTSDPGSAQNGVIAAMRKIADKVADAIKKAGTPAK